MFCFHELLIDRYALWTRWELHNYTLGFWNTINS